MSTARDLITMCLKDIGAIAAGETPTSAESSDALSMLNNMMDRWGTNGLTLYDQVIEKFNFTGSQQAYTMGSGGDFNTTRPVQVLRVGLEIESSNPPKELPIHIVNLDQWATIIVKTVSTTLPVACYINEGFPLITFNFWPEPSDSSNKAVIYSLKPLSSFATLDTTFSLPPGYWEALQYNLDVRLAPQYGRQLRPEIIEMARESLADIKRSNVTPQYLGTDQALHNNRNHFNWLIGE